MMMGKGEVWCCFGRGVERTAWGVLVLGGEKGGGGDKVGGQERVSEGCEEADASRRTFGRVLAY